MTGAARGKRGRLGAAPIGQADPFAVLAVPASAGLTDEQVRAAWRRIAAATHPDRADGGDPERFAAAAAAYTELRTPSGRGEARAALALARAHQADRHRPGRHRADRLSPPTTLVARVRYGRPIRLALRAIGSVAVGTIAVLAAGPGPAGPALATGALTWLLVTMRADLS